jgi:hypothetical protein
MTRRSKLAKNKKQILVLPKIKKMSKQKDKEVTRLGYALRALGSLGGGALGNMIGQGSAGQSIGSNLGATVSRWLGSGDYSVNNNTLLSASGTIPAMHSGGQSVIVRHKEFVSTIMSSTDFTVASSFPLNPGMGQTFPWLSRVAAGFQEYRIKGMIFHYIPSSGDAIASTNPALGTVMLQTSYRSTDNPPSSKLEILNEYWATESVPSQSFCHPIECDPKENPFNVQYVRNRAVPTGDTQLMYDLGTTHVATQGMQTNGNPVGDLWVTYEVELKKPVIASNSTGEFYYAAEYPWQATNVFFRTTPVVAYGSSIVLPASDRTVTLPKGINGVFSLYFGVRSSSNTQLDFANDAVFTNCTPIYITGTNTSFTSKTTTMAVPPIGVYSRLYHILINDQSVQATVTYNTLNASGVYEFIELVIAKLY